MQDVTPLDLPTARRLMAEVRDTVPADFRYNNTGDVGAACFYAPLPQARKLINPEVRPSILRAPIPGDPREETGCLIGRVLDQAGFSFHWASVATIGNLAEGNPRAFDDSRGPVVAYLARAQRVQDEGGTWHDAVAAAEAGLPFQYRNEPVPVTAD